MNNHDTPLCKYNPKNYNGFTIEVTLMKGEYKGHLKKVVPDGISRRRSLSLDYIVENLGGCYSDCNLKFHDYDDDRFYATGIPGYYTVDLKNNMNEILTIRNDKVDFGNLIVSIQIIDFEEEEEDVERYTIS